jgi:hypothetical protein
LYERQKKSFAPTKKDKRLGKTFSFGNFDVHVPGEEDFHPENNQGYTEVRQYTYKNITLFILDSSVSSKLFFLEVQ